MDSTTKQPLPVIPETLAGVTPAWLSSVISKKISPNNFKVAGNAQEGTGFLSQLLRISCEVETETDEPKKELNLIVKLLPIASQSTLGAQGRQIIIDENFDTTEMKFYEIVKPDIIEEVEELSQYLCPYVCGYLIEEPRDSIIVLEDLKPLGYYTLNFGQTVSMQRIEESIRFLAKFHYAGSAVEYKKKKPLSELYPFLQLIPDPTKSVQESTFFSMSLAGIDKIDEFFVSQNCSEEMRDAYKKILPGQRNMAKSIFNAMHKYPTMVHGDLWANNILYNDDENLTLKAIDWQLLGYGDAAYDLAVLIVAILPASELNTPNVERLLGIYLDTYEEYCRKNGLEVLLRRSRKDFSDFFYTYGMGYVFLWFSYSPYPFSLNFPKLLRIYEFLYKDSDIIPFLLNLSS